MSKEEIKSTADILGSVSIEEIHKSIKYHRMEIDALRMLEKVLLKEECKMGVSDKHAIQVYLELHGPSRVRDIAADIGVAYNNIYTTIKRHPSLFTNNGGLIGINQ